MKSLPPPMPPIPRPLAAPSPILSSAEEQRMVVALAQAMGISMDEVRRRIQSGELRV